jgi:zinc protease
MPPWWLSATSIIRRCFALAAQHYGPLQARQLPVRKPQDEPPQLGTRRLSVKAPADLPLLMMAYKVPVIRHVEQDVDPYALEILAAVLAGHDAARFSTSLVRRQQLAVEGRGRLRFDRTRAGHLLSARFSSEGKSVSELEAGLRAEIAAVQESGVSADELARAKAQLIAGQIYKLDSMFAQAMEIGQLEAVGIPYTQKRRLLEKLQEVTAAQVRRLPAGTLLTKP